MDVDEDDRIVVVDNGSSFIKAGLSQDAEPRVRLAFSDGRIARFHHNKYGQDLREKNNLVDVKCHPIEAGNIRDWDCMESFWYEMFWNGIGIKSFDSSVLITEPLVTTYSEREKILEIMFDKFSVKRLGLLNQVAITSNRRDEEAGVFVDVGHENVCIVSVLDGKPVEDTIIRIPVGGRFISRVVSDALSVRHAELFMNKSADEKWNAACEAKEKSCYVARDYKSELAELEQESITLSTGDVVKLADEVIRGPEVLFNPSLHGLSFPSIQQAVLKSRNSCPELVVKGGSETRIVVTGGSALLKDFNDRLNDELERIDPTFSVVNLNDPLYGAWKGAVEYVKKYDGIDGTNNIWISKEEYGERGVQVLNRMQGNMEC